MLEFLKSKKMLGWKIYFTVTITIMINMIFHPGILMDFILAALILALMIKFLNDTHMEQIVAYFFKGGFIPGLKCFVTAIIFSVAIIIFLRVVLQNFAFHVPITITGCCSVLFYLGLVFFMKHYKLDTSYMCIK